MPRGLSALGPFLLTGLLAIGCGVDGPAEVPSDVGADIRNDSDVGTDATSDVGASPDTGGDAESDVSADSGADAEPDTVVPPTDHAEHVAEIWSLLPPDARGVLAVDAAALGSGDMAAEAADLFVGEGADPALTELFGTIGALVGSVDLARVVESALLVQTLNASEGLFVLAVLNVETLAEAALEPAPTPDGAYGSAETELYVDASGTQLALLDGGVLVAGSSLAVRSVIDVFDGTAAGNASELEALWDAFDAGAHFSFVYGLPALFDESVIADRSLHGAVAVSGALNFSGGDVAGEVRFHSDNASDFVDAYNYLNRHAVLGENGVELPLIYEEPVVPGLGQAVVPIPATPLDRSFEEVMTSRNTLKELFVGMEAYDYAEDVDDPGNAALVDLIVLSEQDEQTPRSPGSVFIRWEFEDEAAIEAFEQDVLPEGFTLAPCRFLESDDPDGEYFLALNLYNAGGGSIVNGARAEWDVFVNPPDGADPDAGVRPRFMVIDALAQSISADPVHLITPAEPMSHMFVGDQVVSTVDRFDEGEQVSVFQSSFPLPSPSDADVARFTREMAIGNDYIYWGHGVYDRVVYNASTFNHDAYFVDPADVVVEDDSRWAQYLNADIMDVIYYVNTLEYVASPLANLGSAYLDVTPEWLGELVGFKTNGHQLAMMRNSVEQLFRGTADALVPYRLPNARPSTFFSFEITDVDAMSAALELPPGYDLAPTSLFEGDEAKHYVTLALFETEGALEGLRSEWRVYVDDGRGRVRVMIADWQSEEVAVDPVHFINLPSDIGHELADGVVTSRVGASGVSFDASFALAGATDRVLSLDWIESGDDVCHRNGICDKYYYDAETLDVPVHQPASVSIENLTTPWDAFIDASAPIVFYRDNAQELAAKRWHNLRVVVEELPFDGLAGATHTIGGTGSLTGRDSDLVDSDYSYSGDAVVDGDQLTFAIDQAITNILGDANIYTAGTFDLSTGAGTQTVTGCAGPPLMCSGIETGTTSLYEAQNLDASNLDAIVWNVDVVVDLGGSFGLADSASTFAATRAE